MKYKSIMSNKQQYDDNMMGQQTSNDGQSINSVNNLTSGQTILNNHNTQSDHQDERYFLRWNDFTKNVSVEFERLREDEDLVDITFACDGRKIGAHKLVLFASSQYFKNILKNNSCSHPIFYMNDVRFDVLEAILKYIYLGEVQIKNEDLKDFIKIAEALQVKGISKERYGGTPTNLDHQTINNSSNQQQQQQHQVGLHLNTNNNNNTAYHHGHHNNQTATTTATPSTAHHHNHNQPQQHQNQQQLSIHIAPSHSSTSSINSISSSRGSNSTGGGIIEGNINIISTTGTVAANDDNNERHHLDNNSHQQQQHHHHQSTSSSNGNGASIGGNNTGTGKQHHHNQQQQPPKIDGSNHTANTSLPILTNINLVAQAHQQHQQQHNNHHHGHQPIESKIEIVEYKNESCSSPNYCHMEASLSHRLGASSSASTPNAMATDEMWEDKASTVAAAAAAVSAVYSAGLHHSAAAVAAVAAVAAGHHVGGGSSSGDETKGKPYHIKTKRPRSCPVCSRVYSNVSNLRQHMRLIHNPTAVICPVCQKRFNSDLYLKRHLSIHGYTFNQSDNTITDKKLQLTGGGSSTGNTSGTVGNPGGTTTNTWAGCNDTNQIAVASSICR